MAIREKRENAFFVMFRDFTGALVTMGDNFGSIINNYRNIERTVADMKLTESECDARVHAILQKLYESFVTPLDREDIFAIVNQLDDIADFIEEISNKFINYDIASLRPDAVEIGNIIVDAVRQIDLLFNTLPEDHRSNQASKVIIEINRLENLGDVVFRRAINKLFKEETSPIEIIKWKDLYEGLENALDACEHLADTVEGVRMKNA